MKKIAILSLLLSCCAAISAQVIKDTDRPMVEKIRQGNINYTSFSGDFKQSQALSFVDEEIVSAGKFYYKKPDKMALKFTDPEGDMMLVDGDKFIVAAGGSRREVSAKTNPRMQGMKAVLTSCMQGDVMRMGATRITCEETARYYVIQAELPTDTNIFERVEASYDKKDCSLSILKTIDSDGSSTTYELTKKEFSKPLDDSIFK